MTHSTTHRSPQTIEQTGKKWKAIQLGAVAVLVLSILMTFSAMGAEEGMGKDVALAISGTMVALALVAVAVAKVGAWWSNG